MTVNKERVQLLVDALRSGEFFQLPGSLRGEIKGREGHCCLGVATEIALRNGLELPQVDAVADEYGDLPEEAMFPWDMSEQVMCGPVYRWYGFPEGDPDLFDESGDSNSAASWNDDLGADFNQIADMFESTYIRETTSA